ncbi:MAG: hypothetical protein P8Y00_00240 [Deltaproteobacteria bacterium]
MEKVTRYMAKNGLTYETAKEALMNDFSYDPRAKKVAAVIGCRSSRLLWSLWTNRKAVKALLEDMENALDGQENQ